MATAGAMARGKLGCGESLELTSLVSDVTSLGLKYFGRFGLVMNALDSQEPRSYVNKMCVLAGVGLVESGTAGHLGQTSPIVSQVTECYDCTQKPKRQVTYPTCTIRSTPSKMIHCVVWAKALFSQLFAAGAGAGAGDDDHDDHDEVSPPPAEESTPHQRMRSTRQWAQDCDYDAGRIFDKLFCADIEVLRGMRDLWAAGSNGGRRRQQPCTFAEVRCWPQKAAFRSMFSAALVGLAGRHRPLAFDKDDEQMMAFVHAAANIRAALFGIPTVSEFDAKHMAGAIIPAVATTNAIVAGLAVLQALAVVSRRRGTDDNNPVQMKQVFVNYKLLEHSTSAIVRRPTTTSTVAVVVVGHHLIRACQVPKPNPACTTCSPTTSSADRVVVKLNLQQATIGLLQTILLSEVKLVDPDVCTADGVIFLSPDCSSVDPDKLLKDFGLKDGSIVFAEGDIEPRENNDDDDDEENCGCEGAGAGSDAKIQIIFDHSDLMSKDQFECVRLNL